MAKPNFTPGLSRHYMNSATRVHSTCGACGYNLPVYPGRYPSKCPICHETLKRDEPVAEGASAATMVSSSPLVQGLLEVAEPVRLDMGIAVLDGCLIRVESADALEQFLLGVEGPRQQEGFQRYFRLEEKHTLIFDVLEEGEGWTIRTISVTDATPYLGENPGAALEGSGLDEANSNPYGYYLPLRMRTVDPKDTLDRIGGGLRFHVGGVATRVPDKEAHRAYQANQNARRGLASRIAAVKRWHRSEDGQKFHRALGRLEQKRQPGDKMLKEFTDGTDYATGKVVLWGLRGASRFIASGVPLAEEWFVANDLTAGPHGVAYVRADETVVVAYGHLISEAQERVVLNEVWTHLEEAIPVANIMAAMPEGPRNIGAADRSVMVVYYFHRLKSEVEKVERYFKRNWDKFANDNYALGGGYVNTAEDKAWAGNLGVKNWWGYIVVLRSPRNSHEAREWMAQRVKEAGAEVVRESLGVADCPGVDLLEAMPLPQNELDLTAWTSHIETKPLAIQRVILTFYSERDLSQFTTALNQYEQGETWSGTMLPFWSMAPTTPASKTIALYTRPSLKGQRDDAGVPKERVYDAIRFIMYKAGLKPPDFTAENCKIEKTEGVRVSGRSHRAGRVRTYEDAPDYAGIDETTLLSRAIAGRPSVRRSKRVWEVLREDGRWERLWANTRRRIISEAGVPDDAESLPIEQTQTAVIEVAGRKTVTEIGIAEDGYDTLEGLCRMGGAYFVRNDRHQVEIARGYIDSVANAHPVDITVCPKKLGEFVALGNGEYGFAFLADKPTVQMNLSQQLRTYLRNRGYYVAESLAEFFVPAAAGVAALRTAATRATQSATKRRTDAGGTAPLAERPDVLIVGEPTQAPGGWVTPVAYIRAEKAMSIRRAIQDDKQATLGLLAPEFKPYQPMADDLILVTGATTVQEARKRLIDELKRLVPTLRVEDVALPPSPLLTEMTVPTAESEDGHTHMATVDVHGNGRTSVDGETPHWHRVIGGLVEQGASAGSAHLHAGSIVQVPAQRPVSDGGGDSGPETAGTRIVAVENNQNKSVKVGVRVTTFTPPLMTESGERISSLVEYTGGAMSSGGYMTQGNRGGASDVYAARRAIGRMTKTTIDDDFDAIVRKLTIFDALSTLQDVEFDEQSGAMYLFFDPSLLRSEVDAIIVEVSRLFPTALVASPNKSLPGETASSDWWVTFVQRADAHPDAQTWDENATANTPVPGFTQAQQPSASVQQIVPVDAVAAIPK